MIRLGLSAPVKHNSLGFLGSDFDSPFGVPSLENTKSRLDAGGSAAMRAKARKDRQVVCVKSDNLFGVLNFGHRQI